VEKSPDDRRQNVQLHLNLCIDWLIIANGIPGIEALGGVVDLVNNVTVVAMNVNSMWGQ